MALKRSIIWLDAGGRTTLTIPCTSAGASSIMSALQGKSNADVQEWWEGFDNVLFPTPSSSLYPDTTDSARLTFTDTSGSLANLSLVAPQASIFMADGVTVNPAAIAAIIGASIGNLCSGAGGVVTSYVSGIRVLRPDRN